MCKNQNFCCIAVIASVLVSLAVGVLAYLGLIPELVFAPWIALGFSVLSIIILTIAATSLLRQDKCVDICVCRKGVNILTLAFLTLLFSIVALLAGLTNQILTGILIFLIFLFLIYQAFSLYCFLYCIITAGCRKNMND